MVPRKFRSSGRTAQRNLWAVVPFQECIVLPRAHDVVTDILDLLEPLEPPLESIGKMDWGAELLVVDFSDAFLSLLWDEKEKRYTVVTEGQGKWFAYRRITVWHCVGTVRLRTRCYLTRLAQAVYHSAQEARVQLT